MNTRDPKLLTLTAAMFLISFALILMELLLTRLFAIVLFAQFAHLALAVGMLGISLGAVLQHLWPKLLPAEGLERRVAWFALLMGLLAVVAVLCTLDFPLIDQAVALEGSYGERSKIRDSLLHIGWFSALLPILTLPFVSAGLVFAGVFQRRRQWIGRLYGADLVGGAMGAIAFVPVLGWLAGPDSVFVVVIAASLAALLLFRVSNDRKGLGVAGLFMVAGLGLSAIGASGIDILKVQAAAGFSERNVVWSDWTPLARVSVHEKGRKAIMVLDNTSRSEVVRTKREAARYANRDPNRSLVYLLHQPPARIAILAASAGPEVAVAQYWGYTDIDAIDIAGEVMDTVATRYADAPANPYTHGNTRRIKSDGRAAILHASQPYDIIEMVHANLWSYGGLLADAWSPSLLETKEAFTTYFDKLTPDGTISFGRGKSTDAIVRSAAAALRERGVKEPWRHMFYARASNTVLLVKPRPFTKAERDKLVVDIARFAREPKVLIDPTAPRISRTVRHLLSGPVMTDDRPYLDNPKRVIRQFTELGSPRSGQSETPLAMLYRSIFLQAAFVLLAGVLFMGIPMLRRGPNELAGLRRVPLGLAYVGCLGYGYLSVETVLVHELVLFVGHPTYAVTTVILAMLASSGLGSMAVERLDARQLLPALRITLLLILGLGALQAFVIPPALNAIALGWPLSLRIGIVILGLAPLGFAMGTPFPLAMRLLHDDAGGLVPWAWALNGWMSVVASLSTVVLSRLYGYSWAFGAALGAYALALALSGTLTGIRRG